MQAGSSRCKGLDSENRRCWCEEGGREKLRGVLGKAETPEDTTLKY